MLTGQQCFLIIALIEPFSGLPVWRPRRRNRENSVLRFLVIFLVTLIMGLGRRGTRV